MNIKHISFSAGLPARSKNTISIDKAIGESQLLSTTFRKYKRPVKLLHFKTQVSPSERGFKRIFKEISQRIDQQDLAEDIKTSYSRLSSKQKGRQRQKDRQSPIKGKKKMFEYYNDFRKQQFVAHCLILSPKPKFAIKRSQLNLNIKDVQKMRCKSHVKRVALNQSLFQMGYQPIQRQKQDSRSTNQINHHKTISLTDSKLKMQKSFSNEPKCGTTLNFNSQGFSGVIGKFYTNVSPIKTNQSFYSSRSKLKYTCKSATPKYQRSITQR